LLTISGRHHEALELCDAHAARMASGEVWGLERGSFLAVRARALGGLGRAGEARPLIEQALSEAESYSPLLHFDRLADAIALALLLRDDVLLQRAGRLAGAIARASGMPGLMVRYAGLEKQAQAAGRRLSTPPV
jgi:hypothetical protein